MSRSTKARPARTRCMVSGCEWYLVSPSLEQRDREWADHWRTAHSNPTTHTTRCPVTGCGWSTTTPDLDELRRLAGAHRSTHEGTRPR